MALDAPARRLRFALAEQAVVRHEGERPLRVLDAGCGDGLLALRLAKRHPRWTLVGVDVREGLLSGARARARARRLENVRFVRGDLTEPLEESGFDVVLSIECLEEIDEDERALQTMAAALAPAGLLVAQVPERSWTPVLPRSPREWRDQVRQGYGGEQLESMLRGAGLEVLELRPTFRTTAVVAQELRDRVKGAPLWARALAFPPLAAAATLERHGLSAGRPHALIAVARRSGSGS